MTTNQPSLSLTQLENFLVRLGLIGGGMLCLYVASTLWESGDVVRQAFSQIMALAAYATAFTCFGLAAWRGLPYRAIWITPAVLTLAFIGMAQNHAVNQHQFGMLLSTDVYIFSDYAAILTRLGENPYHHDLGDAYRAYRSSSTYSTPTTDGDYIGKIVYPALSFLVFLPFQYLGIPTALVYPFFYWVVLVVVFAAAPRLIRPVILLPLLVEPRYILYALGGVSDTLWALMVVLMVIFWRNRLLSAIWFGLACALKQQPWLLVPFLAIRLWHESTEEDRTFRVLEVLQYFLIAGGVFTLVNLPFILWDLPAWLTGAVSPFFDRMITLGQGLSSLTTQGVVMIPRSAYTAYMLLAYAACIFVYWRHFDSLKSLIWLFPGLVLWMGQRSLSSYWYFNLIPFVLGLAHDALPWPPALPRAVNWRPTVAVAGGAAALIVISIAGYRAAGSPLSMAVQRPIETDGHAINRLTIQVTNNSDRPVQPRFSVQSWTDQPYFWDTLDGPETLPPATSGYYRISTTIPGEMADMTAGGQVIVSDAHDDGLRASEVLQGNAVGNMDAIPNGTFEYLNRFTGTPALWGLINIPTQSGGTAALVESEQFGHALRLTLQPADIPDRVVTMLDTWVTMPEAPITVWVNPPQEANRAPDFDLIYGLELLSTFDGGRVWVLFGDERQTGEIEPGLPYLMLPTPRGVWTQQSIDVRGIFQILGIEIAPPQWVHTRFDTLTFPKQMLNFRLLLAARHQPNALVSADFGPVASSVSTADPQRLIEQAIADPTGVYVIRGDLSRAVHNDEVARAYYQTALQHNPNSAEAHYGLGDIALRGGEWDAAAGHFEIALGLGYSRDALARGGLAWAYYQQGRLDEAQTEAETALRAMTERVFFYDGVMVAELYRTAGWIALDGERYEAAQAAFSEALRNDNRDAEAYAGLGMVRLRMGDAAGAANALKSAIEIRLSGDLPASVCEDAPALSGILGEDAAILLGACD